MEDTTPTPPATPPQPEIRTHAQSKSVRYFLTELAIVTAGVFIALSIDSVRGWFEHRALVAEARRNINQEIQDNNREIETVLKDIPNWRAQIDNGLKLANELLATKTSSIHQLNLGSTLGDLTDANWKSAERTGALSFMEYAEVQKYSKLYELQALYSEIQRRQLEKLASTISILADNPYKASPKDLELFRERVFSLRGDLVIAEQMGTRLKEGYASALAR